jgi:hypothetical protein
MIERTVASQPRDKEDSMANDANEDNIAAVTFTQVGAAEAARLINLMDGAPEVTHYELEIKKSSIDLSPIDDARHTRVVVFIDDLSNRHATLLGMALQRILSSENPPVIQLFDAWSLLDLPEGDWVSVFMHSDFKDRLTS